jgi:Zn-dependent protease
MLQEPAETPYDLRFQVFGFPVRVSWSFWLGAIVIGHPWVQSFDSGFGADSPGMGPLLVLWIVALFLSILIHELGHAFAFRQQGIHSSIVLYHFGGLAIPIASLIPGRSVGRLTPKQNIWVSFAGPLLEIVAAIVLAIAIRAVGYEVAAMRQLPFGLDVFGGPFTGEPIENPALLAFLFFFIFPSIVWALFNLVPVWPLDGGHIMRSILLLTGGNVSQSLWISVATAGVIAAYSFTHGQAFMGIFFALFAVQSFQMLQQISGRHY